MKLKIRVQEINYGDVAVKAMPLLGERVKNRSDAIGEVLAAFCDLPEDLIQEMFNAIPKEKKNGIVASLSEEYRGKILYFLNRLSAENGIGVQLKDFTVSRALEMEAEIAEIDYLTVTKNFLPVIRKKLMEMGGITVVLRPVIANAPAERIVGLVDRISGGHKDAFLASLINRNPKTLISGIESAAEKQNIRLKIASVFVEA